MLNFDVSLKKQIYSSIINNEALLLDFDGTLMNYQENEKKALEMLFSNINIPTNLQNKVISDYVAINNFYWSEFDQKKISIDDARHKGFEDLIHKYHLRGNSKDMNKEFLEFLIKTTVIDDKIKSKLHILKELGTKIIIITNGSHKAQSSRLKNSGLLEIIDTYFTSESVGYPKPHPKMFEESRKYLDSINCSTDNIWVIGDSLEADIKGAYNVGFDRCWITDKTKFENNGYPLIIASNFLEFTDFYLDIKKLKS